MTLILLQPSSPALSISQFSYACAHMHIPPPTHTMFVYLEIIKADVLTNGGGKFGNTAKEKSMFT